MVKMKDEGTYLKGSETKDHNRFPRTEASCHPEWTAQLMVGYGRHEVTAENDSMNPGMEQGQRQGLGVILELVCLLIFVCWLVRVIMLWRPGIIKGIQIDFLLLRKLRRKKQWKS